MPVFGGQDITTQHLFTVGSIPASGEAAAIAAQVPEEARSEVCGAEAENRGPRNVWMQLPKLRGNLSGRFPHDLEQMGEREGQCFALLVVAAALAANQTAEDADGSEEE